MKKLDRNRWTLALVIWVVPQIWLDGGPTVLAQTCRQVPANAVAWWPGDGHRDDLLSFSLDAVGDVGYVQAVVEQGFLFDGSTSMTVADYPSINFNISHAVAGWIRVDRIPTSGESILLDKRTPGASVPVGFVLSALEDHSSGSQKVALRFTVGDGTSEFSVRTFPFPTGEFQYVTASLDGHAGTMYIDVNGVRHDSSAVPDRVNATNGSDLFIGRPVPEFAGQFQGLVGVIDELIFAGTFYDECEIAEMIAAGSAGICRGDTDEDGLFDYEDNCPLVPNPDQLDWDFDDAGNACDCMPLSVDGISAATEVRGLRVGIDSERHKLKWCIRTPYEGWGNAFNVARGLVRELSVESGPSDTCLASGLDWPDWIDPAVPPSGEAYWYLVRAATPCGAGDYGSGSPGAPRDSSTLVGCPISEAEVCEQTSGTWDPAACGHYVCGVPRDCTAVIPGCDCGPLSNYQYGLGCEADPVCL